MGARLVKRRQRARPTPCSAQQKPRGVGKKPCYSWWRCARDSSFCVQVVVWRKAGDPIQTKEQGQGFSSALFTVSTPCPCPFALLVLPSL
jgi:hypothetical protein